MKPLDGTFAQNALRHGVAGLNVDGSRIGMTQEDADFIRKTARPNSAGHLHIGSVMNRPPTPTVNVHPSGRWPANLLLDEEAAALLDQQSGETRSSDRPRHNGEFKSVAKGRELPHTTFGHADTGGASRFFYVAKASRREREAGLDGMPERDVHRYGGGVGRNDTPTSDPNRPASNANFHPTVKPLRLMEYLCTLTATPTGGVVLDPFCGSGTTGVACVNTGRSFVGIEREPDYLEIARRRIAHAQLPLWAGADSHAE
jgi:site-specific DNA-methyltransferase (adenine-specific)